MAKQYTVSFTVQMAPGDRFIIRFASRSRQWEALRDEFLHEDRVLLPPDHFHYTKIVPDEVRFRFVNSRLEAPLSNESRPGCVVIVLESPHSEEYTSEEEGFIPIGPLRNPASMTRLRNQLPRLLMEAGISGDVDVVLSNPIPFQTSLHRLMKPEYQTGIQQTVRNSIWKAIYTAEECGERPFEQDFLNRIHNYRPGLIINACTAAVKGYVQKTLDPLPYRTMGVTHHPSYWSRITRLI